MAGIETDTQAATVVGMVNYIGQFIKAGAKTGSLACGGFQQDRDRYCVFSFFKSPVKICSQLLQAIFCPGPDVGTGVHDEVGYGQQGGPAYFFGKGSNSPV